MTDDGRLIRPHAGSSRPGLLAVLAMVGDAPAASPLQALAAGGADLGTAAAVLVVGVT
jgi:hypothetical protein